MIAFENNFNPIGALCASLLIDQSGNLIMFVFNSNYLNSASIYLAETSFIRFLAGFFKFLHNGYLIKRKKDIVLLSHFGLGDQIIIGRLINKLSMVRNVTLLVDSKYFEQLGTYYSYNQNVYVKKIGYLRPEYYPRVSDLAVFRNTFSLPIIDVGRNVIFFLSAFYRNVGVSKLYYLAGWDSGDSFTNYPAYHHHYKKNISVSPNKSFAFVDHHVGTNREIPGRVFETLRNEGLEVKFNDMNLTLIDQLSTIVDAHQLHLVASAPFCLALAMPCKAKQKFFYEMCTGKSVLGEEGSNWLRASCV